MEREVTGLLPRIRQHTTTEQRMRTATEYLTNAGFIVHRAPMRPVFRGDTKLVPRRDKVFGSFHLIATSTKGTLHFISVTTRNRMRNRKADIEARVPMFAGGVSQEVWGWQPSLRHPEGLFVVHVRDTQTNRWRIGAPVDAYASSGSVTPTATPVALSLPSPDVVAG